MQLNTRHVGLGGGSLLQYATRGPHQGMGYLLKTPEGKLVMIDGGRDDFGDGDYTRQLIREHGDRVDLWIMTHAHNDHFGALSRILQDTETLDFEIADLRFTFPPLEWIGSVENGGSLAPVSEFYRQLGRHGIVSTHLAAGDVIECGGLTIDVLSDGTDYESYHTINDTSTVLRVHFPSRDVLFLGDLGAESANAILSRVPAEALRCDIVQMAHHGQGGAERNFYEVVRPKVALYTAPMWLWECDNGKGRGSGPWQTLKTRAWLDELGVQVSCPHAYGDYLLI